MKNFTIIVASGCDTVVQSTWSVAGNLLCYSCGYLVLWLHPRWALHSQTIVPGQARDWPVVRDLLCPGDSSTDWVAGGVSCPQNQLPQQQTSWPHWSHTWNRSSGQGFTRGGFHQVLFNAHAFKFMSLNYNIKNYFIFRKCLCLTPARESQLRQLWLILTLQSSGSVLTTHHQAPSQTPRSTPASLQSQTCPTPPSTHQPALMLTAASALRSLLNDLLPAKKHLKGLIAFKYQWPKHFQESQDTIWRKQKPTTPFQSKQYLACFITSFHSVKDLNKHLKDNNSL